jgi:hypothetical protein
MGSLRDALYDEFISIGDAFVMDDFCAIVLVHLQFNWVAFYMQPLIYLIFILREYMTCVHLSSILKYDLSWKCA